MNFYVYRLDHIETDEYYIGSRCCKCKPRDDSKYLGSMKTWKTNKYKLKKRIIKLGFKTVEECLRYEAKLISKNINNPLNRNYSIPPEKFNTNGMVTVKDKNGKTFMVSIENENYKNGTYKHVANGYVPSKNARERIGKAAKKRQTGKGNVNYGKIWITNNKENKLINRNELIPNNWNKGRTIISSKIWITDGVNNKLIDKNDLIPSNWNKGRTMILSELHIEKVRQTGYKNKYRKLTEEHKNKLRNYYKKK